MITGLLRTYLVILLVCNGPIVCLAAGKASSGDYFERANHYAPTIKRIADQYLRQEGYRPEQLTAQVVLGGSGGEDWRVIYWHTAPSEDTVYVPADLEIFLYDRQILRRGRYRLVVHADIKNRPPAQNPRKDQADAVLRKRGYDPTQYAGIVWNFGRWRVEYWRAFPTEESMLMAHPDLTVLFDETGTQGDLLLH